MSYKNIAGRFFGLVTKHACDRQTDGQTDGRTDRQNYDSQERASIAASRGKNWLYLITNTLCARKVWTFMYEFKWFTKQMTNNRNGIHKMQ